MTRITTKVSREATMDKLAKKGYLGGGKLKETKKIESLEVCRDEDFYVDTSSLEDLGCFRNRK